MANETISTSVRICTGCGEEKPLTVEFYPRRDDGFRLRCKICHAAANRQYYLRNDEAIKEKSRLDYNNNKPARSAKADAWRRGNPEKMAAYRQKWRGENRDKERIAYNAALSSKRASSGLFRMQRAVSRSVWGFMRGNKSGRKWRDILGYDADDLRRHIERQFVKGMTWDNYGEWHLDHIVPVSSFVAHQNEETIHECWALSNLRPLWAKDNMTKHAKRVYLI